MKLFPQNGSVNGARGGVEDAKRSFFHKLAPSMEREARTREPKKSFFYKTAPSKVSAAGSRAPKETFFAKRLCQKF